jgi:hypothetical protein
MDLDPLVRDMDPWIRIRTKMSRIRNTGFYHSQGRVKTMSWQAEQDVLKGT